MADIVHIFISSGHNYFGHHGVAPGAHAEVDCAEIECVAGQGLRGDRFFGYRENYKGQVTFFALEAHEALERELGVTGRSPGGYRRNIITRGLDLNALIGRRFSLGGVRFEGTGECSPCAWMNAAMAPGAEQLLCGRGGLRARILSDGILRIGNHVAFEMLDETDRTMTARLSSRAKQAARRGDR